MTSPAFEFQQLVFATLSGSAEVTDVVSGVFDGPPKGVAAPFVSLGASDEVPGDAQCITASRHTLSVHVWSERGGKQECKDLLFVVKKLFHGQRFSLSTHAISNVQVGGQRVFRDPDGITLHGTIAVSAIIEER